MSLADDLAGRIRRDGPLPVEEIMGAALRHYYASRDPFGRGGDFITAPEISQMYGELLGLWAVVVWEQMGRPDPFILAEMGPGRGTLMADALRAARLVPDFGQAARIVLIETSPALRERQRQTLAAQGVAPNASWVERFEDLPGGPLVLLANELFDALPIRQLVRQNGQWHERVVALDEAGGLRLAVGPPVPDVPAFDGGDGAIAELCPVGQRLAARIGQRLAEQGGAALIVDYGYAQPAPGDSLQAVKAHRYQDVLAQLGEADLTAHVDFSALLAAATPARGWGPLPQGALLLALGIEPRAARLIKGGASRAKVEAELRRLIDPGEMGTLFKAIALTHPALPAPPGFDL